MRAPSLGCQCCVFQSTLGVVSKGNQRESANFEVLLVETSPYSTWVEGMSDYMRLSE